MQPYGSPSRMLEKSCVRVKLGSCTINWCSEKQFSLDNYRKHDLSIYLLALVCESAKALGSG